jgi:hypothetical protein
LFAALTLLGVGATSRSLLADGCHVRERGSSSACCGYRCYSAVESWDNSHRCEQRGSSQRNRPQ